HQMLPSTSCSAANFDVGSTTSKHVKGFDVRLSRYQPATAGFFDGSGNALSYMEICFTPRGRTFFRYTGGATAWQPLTQVPYVEVTNPGTTMRRYVVLPPNGAARLETRVQ